VERFQYTHDKERLEKILSIIPNNIGSLLDAGCGDGRILNAVAAKAKEAVGLDVSQEGLDHVAAMRILGTVERLPILDSAFDCVICCEVLEHLNDESLSLAVSNICRASSKYVLITVPFKEKREFGQVKCEACLSIFHGSYHLRSFSLRTLEELFVEQNYELLNWTTSGRGKYRSTFLTKISQVYADYYPTAREGILCPICGNDKVLIKKPRQHLVSAVSELINRCTGILMPSQPLNIIALFRRRGSEEC